MSRLADSWVAQDSPVATTEPPFRSTVLVGKPVLPSIGLAATRCNVEVTICNVRLTSGNALVPATGLLMLSATRSHYRGARNLLIRGTNTLRIASTLASSHAYCSERPARLQASAALMR